MEAKFRELDRSGFLRYVFDYEHNSTWKYQGLLPCLIDFHDEACPPCQALEPELRKTAEAYGNQLLFYRVDFEKESQLAAELGIRDLPTLVLCPLDGKPLIMQGATSMERLMEIIERELNLKGKNYNDQDW